MSLPTPSLEIGASLRAIPKSETLKTPFQIGEARADGLWREALGPKGLSQYAHEKSQKPGSKTPLSPDEEVVIKQFPELKLKPDLLKAEVERRKNLETGSSNITRAATKESGYNQHSGLFTSETGELVSIEDAYHAQYLTLRSICLYGEQLGLNPEVITRAKEVLPKLKKEMYIVTAAGKCDLDKWETIVGKKAMQMAGSEAEYNALSAVEKEVFYFKAEKAVAQEDFESALLTKASSKLGIENPETSDGAALAKLVKAKLEAEAEVNFLKKAGEDAGLKSELDAFLAKKVERALQIKRDETGNQGLAWDQVPKDEQTALLGKAETALKKDFTQKHQMEIKKEVAAGIGVSEADWDEPQGTKVVSRLKEIGAETVKEEMLNQNIAFQEQARLEAIKASGKTEAEFEALANKQTLLTEATSKLWEKRKIEKAKTLNPNFDRLEEPEKQKVLVQAEEDLLSTQVKYGLDLKDDFIPPETAEALIKTLDPVLDQAKKQLAHLEAELVGKNHGHPTELSTEIAAAIVQAGIVDHLIKHGKLNEQGKIYLLKQALRKVYEASDRYYSQTQDPKNPKDAKDLIKTNMPGLVEAIELHQNIPDGTSYVSQIVNETFVNGVPQEVQALLINRESSFADFLTLCEKAYSIKPNESLTFAERLKLVSGGELSKVLEVMKKFPNELHSIFFRVIGEMKLSEQQLTEGIFGAYNQETLELTKGLLERLQQASKGQRIANILIQALMIGSAVLPVAHQSLEGGDDNSDSVIGGKGGNTSGQR